MQTVQSDVDPGMRAILVDWLVEVIEEYRLMPETLYIAVRGPMQRVHRTVLLRALERMQCPFLPLVHS